MKLFRTVLGTAAFAAVTAASIAPATAASTYVGSPSVATTGAALTCDIYRTSAFGGTVTCRLRDTLADSRSVYAVLQTDSWPSARINNTGGSGTTLNFSRTWGSDVTHPNFHFKVCRNNQWSSDNCSGWAVYQG